MRKYIILADSSCDLDAEFQREYDIRVIPGHVKKPDGTEVDVMPGWNDFSSEDFFVQLKRDPNGFSTSPPNVYEFSRAFREAADSGADVICMTISSGISGAYGFAQVAREQVLKDHPEADIRCVDSLRFGPGFGLMVIAAAKLRAEGKTLSETVAWLEENKNRYHQAGWLDDLSFVAKKGRLTHAKAFFGTLAGVKPIGEFDYNGLTTVIGKVKGARAAYATLLDYMEHTIQDAGEQTIYIAHTDRRREAEEYKRLIEEKFHPKAVFIKDVYPFCGVNIGPGLMAAYYVGTPISQGLEAERRIFENYVSGGNKR